MAANTTLDVSSAQVSAICDFTTGHSSRNLCDFIKKDHTGCLLCGPVSGGFTTLLRHVHCSSHKRQAHAYYQCMHTLSNMDRRCSLRSDGPVSRREVVLSYLAERLSHADGVHSAEDFYETSLRFIQHKAGIGTLLGSFKEVHGVEREAREGMCVICMTRSSTMMFQTCRHLCCCVSCSVRLQSEAESSESVQCPVCRRSGTIVPVYIS